MTAGVDKYVQTDDGWCVLNVCIRQVRSFRAEKHATSRHLNEMSMLDVEMGFIKDHTDIMAMIQNTLRHIVKNS
jgi:aspartyl/asparaginyl-tRNA synthetase